MYRQIQPPYLFKYELVVFLAEILLSDMLIKYKSGTR